MDNEMLDHLLTMWRDTHREMESATAELRNQISAAEQNMVMIAEPFKQEMRDLEEQIRSLMLIRRKAHSDIPGVIATFRKGYTRVSYDSKQTDMVLGFLRDVLPDTAKQLESARKESPVAPSVSVKAKEA